MSGKKIMDVDKLQINEMPRSRSWLRSKVGKGLSKLVSLTLVGLAFLPTQLARANPGAIYAATNNGVFKSADEGASWTAANAGLAGIDVFSVAIDPLNPATLYAGALGSGVFKSTDGGQNWFSASSGLDDTIILSLAIDPASPQTIYCGTATSAFFPGSGVFKSTDGAQSWTVSNAGLPAAIIDVVAIDPSNPATLYAGTNFDGVYKSTDGSQNWVAANSGMAPALVEDLVVDPADSAALYAGIGGCSFNCLFPAGVLKSTDGATSWTAVNTGLTDLQVVSLAVDPSNSNVLYAGTSLDGVFKSVDAGANWSLVDSGLQSTLFAIVHLPLVIDPLNPGRIYAGTVNGVFKSTDGGINWSSANNGFPPSTSIFALAIEPAAVPSIASVIAQVESLELNSGQKNSLVTKLRSAEESLARGSGFAAGNQLHAFINQIRALERSGRLDRATASSLINETQAIISAISQRASGRH
jgi:photosystem II stability/assembly factor-like uncharacterized protein